MSPDNSEDIKKQILDAAFDRFCQYGFNKTTMAELALDCRMSTGNIYRFFKSKMDIAAELTSYHFSEMEQLLRELIRKPGGSASRRLEGMILLLLHHTYGCFNDKPKLSELISFISRERKELIEKNIHLTRSLIAEVLSQGNNQGEFDIKDVSTTSEMVYAATVKFHAVPFMIQGFCSLEELEHLARGVIAMILRGLMIRK